jgi:hypothetical protein
VKSCFLLLNSVNHSRCRPAVGFDRLDRHRSKQPNQRLSDLQVSCPAHPGSGRSARSVTEAPHIPGSGPAALMFRTLPGGTDNQKLSACRAKRSMHAVCVFLLKNWHVSISSVCSPGSPRTSVSSRAWHASVTGSVNHAVCPSASRRAARRAEQQALNISAPRTTAQPARPR